MSRPWPGLRGADFDRVFEERAARGENVHGEADFVESLQPATVLDAGCGTGRVAIELARRGATTVGVDQDSMMLEAAQRKAPELEWIAGDLAYLDLRDAAGAVRRFDVALMAGNVLLFLEPGTERQVVARVAAHLAPGGALVSGYQLGVRGKLTLRDYDLHCEAAGLHLAERYATWQRGEWNERSDYAVSVHRSS